MPGATVLTAATESYLEDFLFLWSSIRIVDPRQSICLIDCGLGHRRREVQSIADDRLEILTHRDLEVPVRRYVRYRMWPTWIKPWLILGCRARRVLWLDSDIVVLRGLRDTLRQLNRKAFLVNEPGGVPKIVRTFATDDVADARQLNNPRYRLCAGIVGVDRSRDAELLQCWADRVQWTLADDRRSRHFFDQGCLIWALHHLGLYEAVHSGPEWHLPLALSGISFETLARRAMHDGVGFHRSMREAFPNARYVHCWSRSKLSRQILQYVRALGDSE